MDIYACAQRCAIIWLLMQGSIYGQQIINPSRYMVQAACPRLIGSSQINTQTLLDVMSTYTIKPNNLFVVDLRGEPHLFINHVPHYLEPQLFASSRELMQYERSLVDAIHRAEPVQLSCYKGSVARGPSTLVFKPIVVPDRSIACTEASVVRALGARYIRIPNEDYAVPTLDQSYVCIKQIAPLLVDPKNHFLFHCYMGKGRTGFYVVLFDMLMHARTDTYESIVRRHVANGYRSLAYDNSRSKAKRTLLKHLYEYIRLNNDGFATKPAPLDD